MISFLIPAYNEADAIQNTIRKLKHVADALNLTYEIIVIDDGSKDDTAALAESTGVKVVRQPSNGGYGRALKRGMLEAQYEWCAILDADGTYPIEQFPALLAYVPCFDMVVGARTGVQYWGSLRKRLGRLALLKLVSYVIGTSIPDANSGMRIFRKEIALRHVRRISSGFSFTVTLTLAMFLEEHFVCYVPIEYHKRIGNSKVKLTKDSLRVLQILVQAVLYYNPLKLFLSTCFLSVGFGALVALVELLLGEFQTGLLFLAISVQIAILIGTAGYLAEALRLNRLASEK